MDKIIIGIAFAYIIFIVSYPIILKRKVKNAGECIYSFAQFNKVRTVLIYCFSFLLIGLVCFMKNFSIVVRIILELCGIFGAYISCKESFYGSVSGIYTNGVISTEGIFFYDDILTLPIENLSQEEKEKYPGNSIVMATRSKGNVEIHFSTDEECEKAKTELYKLCPRLKEQV